MSFWVICPPPRPIYELIMGIAACLREGGGGRVCVHAEIHNWRRYLWERGGGALSWGWEGGGPEVPVYLNVSSDPLTV